jgi:hypothetical protein
VARSEGTGTTTTRTVRIEDTIDRALHGLAADEGVSVNYLVNRALRKLVEWDAHAERFGVVSVPTAQLDRMMGYLTEEQARDFGAWVGNNLVREFLTFWFKDVSARTLMQAYPRLSSQYGRLFEYVESSDGSRWTIVLKHGGGRKWSVYYEELLRAMFREILGVEASIAATDGQVVARFDSTKVAPSHKAAVEVPTP